MALPLLSSVSSLPALLCQALAGGPWHRPRLGLRVGGPPEDRARGHRPPPPRRIPQVHLHPALQSGPEQVAPVLYLGEDPAGPSLRVDLAVDEGDLALEDLPFDWQVDALELGHDPDGLLGPHMPGVARVEVPGDPHPVDLDDLEDRAARREGLPSVLVDLHDDSIMRAGDLSSRDQSLTLLQLTLRDPPTLDRRLQLQVRVLHLELLDLEILHAQRVPADESLGAPQLGPRHLEGRLTLVDRDLATLQGRGANLHLRQDILVEEPAHDLAGLDPVAWPHQAFLDQAHVVGAHRGGAVVIDGAFLQQDDR